MNSKTYVQYCTKNGHIKTIEVERQVDGSEIIYNLTGINEEFFILGVYDNNQRLFGLSFMNVDNLDMLAFLNSEFQSIDALPQQSFFQPLQYVAIVKQTSFLNNNFDVISKDNQINDTNELKFFRAYLNEEFPNKTITIVPFVSLFEIDLDPAVFYYASVYGSGVSITSEENQLMRQITSHDWFIFKSLNVLGGTEGGLYVRGYKAFLDIAPIPIK